MTDATPTAKIQLGKETIEREVCSIEFRTRSDGQHIVTLAGGHDLSVGDEEASSVLSEYLETRLKKREKE